MKLNFINRLQSFRFILKPRLLGISAVIIAGTIGVFWIIHHVHAESAAADASSVPTVATVAVAKIGREDLYQEITIPAEFRPYQQVELHAKVSGYVKEMNVDFGDKVKAGQLLATLEVPELQDELNSALATEQHTRS